MLARRSSHTLNSPSTSLAKFPNAPCCFSMRRQTEEAAKVAAQQEAKAMRRRVEQLEVGARDFSRGATALAAE